MSNVDKLYWYCKGMLASGYTPYEKRELMDMCLAVSCGDSFETISKSTAELAYEFGLNISTNGVGWVISER